MDMWKPYIAATQEMVPDAEKKIVYDRFYIAAHFNDAVSEVRRAEHARLSKEGNTSLKNSRNIFRKSAANMTDNMTDKEIKRLNKYLEVSEIIAEAWAEAWRVKDFNSSLWKYDDEPSAYNAWTAWIEEARKTGLKPMEKMASMVENHLSGIVNAVVLGGMSFSRVILAPRLARSATGGFAAASPYNITHMVVLKRQQSTNLILFRSMCKDVL